MPPPARILWCLLIGEGTENVNLQPNSGWIRICVLEAGVFCLGTAYLCGVSAWTAKGHATAGWLSSLGSAVATDNSERRPALFEGYGWP